MTETYDLAPTVYSITRIFGFPLAKSLDIFRNILANSNQKKMNTNNLAAVLVSNRQFFGLGSKSCRMFSHVNNELCQKGIRAEWFFGATSSDLLNILRDPKYQTIFNIGHGGRSYWRARDRKITQEEISRFYGDLPKKKGKWFQLSCGNLDGLPLGFDVMESPDESCLFYLNSVYNHDMFWRGLPRYNLKETEKINKDHLPEISDW